MIIELQGTLETKEGVSLEGKAIGDLHFDAKVGAWWLVVSPTSRFANASVNSSDASIPLPPRLPSCCGVLARLFSPEGEHYQILRCPGVGHLPTLGPAPSFWHLVSYLKITTQRSLLEKRADWLIWLEGGVGWVELEFNWQIHNVPFANILCHPAKKRNERCSCICFVLSAMIQKSANMHVCTSFFQPLIR